MALPAFALMKTGVLSLNKNVLAADASVKYDIVADLDGGKFEMGTTPEFTKMDNGNWLYKYKPVPTPTKLPVPVKDGYDFTGWTVSAKPDIQKEYSIPAWHKGNLNVKANWKSKDAILMSGRMFNDTIERMSGFWDVTEIRFVKGTPNQSGTDVSEAHDGSIMANIEGNILTVASEGKIFANKDCSVMFDYSDSSRSLSIKTINFYNFDTSNVTDMYCMFGFGFWTSDGGIHPFRLEEINGIENWNTSKVTDMSFMFYACINLKKLDVSNFDTSQVTDMSSMFYYCSSLTSLDVRNFDTSQVTNMSGMFSYCGSLTSLDIRNFDTSQVTNMGGMFARCIELTSLDMRNFDTSKVTDMTTMFARCSELTSLDMRNFDTSKVTDMTYMFYSCRKLTSSITISNPNVNLYEGMFELCSTDSRAKFVVNFASPQIKTVAKNMVATKSSNSNVFLYMEHLTDGEFIVSGPEFLSYIKSLPNYTTLKKIEFLQGSPNSSGHDLSYNKDKSITATVSGDVVTVKCSRKIYANPDSSTMFKELGYQYGNQEVLDTILLSNFYTSEVINMSEMFYDCNLITNLNMKNFNTSNVTNMNRLFSGCRALTSLDVSNFDTSNVENFSGMFGFCEFLTVIDVSNFDISRARDLSWMFSDCERVLKLDISKFNTARVTNLSGMFYDCKALTSLDVSKFDTSNVTNMCHMFGYCEGLTSLDVSKFDTSNVTDISRMFAGCSALTSLDISNFDTSKVTDMCYMFDSCKGLTSLDVSNFDTSKVTDMGYMFSRCEGLTDLNLNNFDTSKVTEMNNMFSGCVNLVNLRLNSFDTQNVKDMTRMFDFCKGLTSLNLNSFDTSNVCDMGRMFYDCGNLKTVYGLEKFSFKSIDKKIAFSSFQDEDLECMFYECANLSGSITVDNPRIPSYESMFSGTSTTSDSKFIVKSSDTTTNGVARALVSTKSRNSNVTYEGICNTLMSGDDFNYRLKSYLAGVNTIRFSRGTPASNGIDLSLDGSGTIVGTVSGNTLNIVSEHTIYANTDSAYMFSNLDVYSIVFDNFDTSYVDSMHAMFKGCRYLTNLDLTNLKFEVVIDASEMFESCTRIRNIIIPNHFKNLKRAYRMFYNCNNLSGEVTLLGRLNAYNEMFTGTSTSYGSRFTVNYSRDLSYNIDDILRTKSPNSNVFKGEKVYMPYNVGGETNQKSSDDITDDKNSLEEHEVNSAVDGLKSVSNKTVPSGTNTVVLNKNITITLNNGSMAMYPVQKIQVNSGKIGDLAKPDLNPKYAGQFGGYFYDKNYTIPVKPNDTVTQDIELYAKW